MLVLAIYFQILIFIVHNKPLFMKRLLFSLFVFTFLTTHLKAQIDMGYQTPDKAILDLADAPLPPFLRINSEGTKGVLIYRKSYKSIEELSEPELRLAGLRINPKTNISSRQRYYYKATLFDIESGKETEIEGLPAEARLSNFTMSPDEHKMAFTNTVAAGVELWIVDMYSHQLHKLTEPILNANMGRPFYWLTSSEELLLKTLPENRSDIKNSKDALPSGPTISSNDGKKAQNRTYQDLLKNKTDEINFDNLTTAELQKVNLTGAMTKWKQAAIYSGVSISPDGAHVLVTTVNKPYSYLVPYRRFPSTSTVYTMNGDLVKVMLEVPLIEDIPQGFMSTRTGPRSLRWRADRSSTLYWAEALDGGDANQEAEFRDAVYEQDAPFTGEKRFLLNTKNRFRGINWCDDELAIASDYWWNTRNTKSYIFNPSTGTETPRLIIDRNYQDRYADPGSFVTHENDMGMDILHRDGNSLYLLGDGYTEDGIKPFVDEYNIKTGDSQRLYQADGISTLEELAFALDMKSGKVLTRIESKTDYPNYFIRNVKTSSLKQITHFENPFKAIQDVHKEVIHYKRDDGLDLSATLYLPPNYDKSKKEKLPMFMWAYPREFKDKSSASQVSSSPHEFTYPYYGSPVFWVMRGYAVLDDAAFPIVGEGEEEPNDSFREQLVGNAKAAIDAVDEMGYIDRDRVAVGGHSYGAFMTANLLSHSNLFAAGIARSGAYNRTLTPFGFQSEQRNYWEAPEIYYGMSPFMHADKMKTPLLLTHGEADNNSGTYPMQSERYFNALKGLGATVRLVMFPKESHGYAARESILHLLWEQDQWLETYVKNKGKESKSELKP